MSELIDSLNLTDVPSDENPTGLRVSSDCPSPCENCNCEW